MDNQQFTDNSQSTPAQASNPYAPTQQPASSTPISLTKTNAPSIDSLDQTIAASSSSYSTASAYDQLIRSTSADSAYGQMTMSSQPNNTYGQSQSSYNQAQNPYGQSQSLYGQAQSSYGQAQSPYGQAQSSYGQSQSPYGNAYSQQPQNPYGHSPYGPAQDPYSQINPYSTPYQGSAYTQPGTPSVPLRKPAEPVYTTEQRKKARTLCITSLLLYVSPYFLYIILFVFGSAYTSSLNYSQYDSGLDVFLGILVVVFYLAHLAGIVLMIVARASYPKFTFAKVLMWIYIGITIAIVITAILIFAFFYYLCSTCSV